ncbi:uncharacterized protein LOC110940537 [Helianthus annuus]|nr:uncharacterized protein LOC110940537 [Helianthus annuus]XP_022037771.1 uncharacterized protein LOC110940537 [Helianthus annuus]
MVAIPFGSSLLSQQVENICRLKMIIVCILDLGFLVRKNMNMIRCLRAIPVMTPSPPFTLIDWYRWQTRRVGWACDFSLRNFVKACQVQPDKIPDDPQAIKRYIEIILAM